MEVKKLTIEEKAKRYDEVIPQLKGLLDGIHEEKCDIMEEDIIKIFHELKENKDEKIRKWLIRYFKEVCDNVSEKEKKSVLDWLEKQGKQKPKFRVGDTIKCKYDDRQFTIKSVDLDKGTYTYTQEGCGNDIDYADKEFELVEQNPAWSEEDEAVLDALTRRLEGEDIHVSPHLAVKCLKSLKERYTWKPSDEQMKQLGWIAKQNKDNMIGKELMTLYQELKKLREE